MKNKNSETRLGNFGKFLASNLLAKVAKKLVTFWVFWSITSVDTIAATVGNVRVTF